MFIDSLRKCERTKDVVVGESLWKTAHDLVREHGI
jgi:hypothetical protein